MCFPAAAWGQQDKPVPGYEGEVQKIVDRAVRAYRTAESYQDRMITRVEMEAEGDKSILPEPMEPMEISFAWQVPDHIALDTPLYGVFSDGKQLWQQLKPIEQYIVQPAPERIELDKLALNEFGVFEPMDQPVVSLLLKPDRKAQQFIPQVERYAGAEKVQRDGKPAHRVRGTAAYQTSGGPSIRVPFDAWFDDESGLLVELTYDHTKGIAEMLERSPMAGKTRVRKYVQQHVFKDIQIDPERFRLTPRPYDRKVARFEPPTEQEFQRLLIGKPAPDFSTVDLDGKPISLEDYKGKVLLLDFWASWCGPCLMAMPSLQKLSEQYKDKPVAIVGVNGDTPDLKSRVKSILEDKNITYRQFTDSTNQVFMDYRVKPIPCLVMIDQKGVLREIRTGYGPGEEKILASQIDQLLAGKELSSAPGG
jgi:thiol-disulfide isomerase/thioredoxin